jgi:hypothetical protein
MNFKRGWDNNRGQVTIFIIAGIIIIAIVILMLILFNRQDSDSPSFEFDQANPEEFLSSCIEESVRENIEELSRKGGSFEGVPRIEFQFNDEEFESLSYLCYTRIESFPCVDIYPSIINQMEIELTESLSESSRGCFESFVGSLESNNYNVNSSYNSVEADLVRGSLVLTFDSFVGFSKGEQSVTLEETVLEFRTNLYDIGIIAHKIIKSETRFNSFDMNNHMLIYPEYKIKSHDAGDSSKVYSIDNENTGESFRFAVGGEV